ncbi:DNA-binding PucR family transcriptional regulator [Tamaricihabitans halophyticus]|uniref:DNA-binding PucR family transcriptional regulator n=1 Tax=Tamaricihabitans halophyticus TaxID=1262583 RepID=A0A4R2QIJ3_9PSEU|nr:helix-turn-helix domain-containing protein [Tamaricihabitans halophyticus]TCP48494.1 DNA-binding PucR family transcriptional regulator [Tamaricihabitans halophyticus]
MATFSTPEQPPGHADLTEQPLGWLVRWLNTELDEVLDSLVDGELAEVPELAIAREDPRAAIRLAVRVHLVSLVNCVGQSPRGGQIAMPPLIDRHARALARQDMPPLTALLRAFEIVHAGLWRRLAAALRDGPYQLAPEHRAEVLELASAHLFAYFQTATKATATAYASERALIERRSMSRRAEVIAALLAGSIPVTEAESTLGYEFNTSHVGYIAWVDALSELDRLDSVTTRLFERLRPRQHLAVPNGERSLFGWISSGDAWHTALREETLPDGIHLALGAPQQGVDGFRASHLEALEARRVSVAVGLTAINKPVLFDDIAVASLASRDLVAANAFVHRQLGRLASSDESAHRLLRTLAVYLEELASPTKTARRLHVHPNTVIKRVERIEEILGRPVDPGSLALRVAVELAPFSGDPP